MTRLCNCFPCFSQSGYCGWGNCGCGFLSFVNLFCLLLQLHELQCPFANVKCEYCEMDLIRDQVSEMMSDMENHKFRFSLFFVLNERAVHNE